MPPIFLASASPRRFQLLRDLGVEFEVVASDFEEPGAPADAVPHIWVQYLAWEKARHCRRREETPESIIIAADTIVVLENAIFGKPRDENEARAMLQRLRGQTHRVLTGLSVWQGEEVATAHEETSVTFGEFSDEFIAAYVATGEPMDKAGAYAAQGRGALLIEKIEGDYWNVVGLPLRRLGKMLAARGVEIEKFWNLDL